MDELDELEMTKERQLIFDVFSSWQTTEDEEPLPTWEEGELKALLESLGI